MGKRKNRQPDPLSSEVVNNVSESSEEMQSEDRTFHKCIHAAKVIRLNELRKNVCKDGFKRKCVVCEKLSWGSPQKSADDNKSEWICLSCGVELCGKDQLNHNQSHFNTSRSSPHCIFVNTSDWSNWCFECEKSIKPMKKNHLREAVECLQRADKITPVEVAPTVASVAESPFSFQKCLDEKEMNFPKVKGLNNLGNTCFFNAVLQCLVQTPYLVKVLEALKEPGEKFTLPGGELKLPDEKDKEKEDEKDVNSIKLEPIEGSLSGWGDFTEILHKTLVELQDPVGSPTYKPSALYYMLKKKTDQCTDGGQHDSHELLRHFMEIVRTEDLKRYQKVILEQLELDSKVKRSNLDFVSKAKVKFYGNQASSLFLGPDPVFRGVLVSTLECLECKHSSQRTETFLDISLPIMNDKPQPPIALKRKSQLDMMNNSNESPTLTKKQLRKQKKDLRKVQKMLNSSAGSESPTEDGAKVEQVDDDDLMVKVDEEAEESDADIEDNVEGESAKNLETVESGYSSEKTGHPSPTESMKPLTLSEAETDEFRSSPDVDAEPLTSEIHEITDKLSKIKVKNTEKSCQHPKRYKTSEDDCSVKSCLNQFTALELLNGNNKVGCEACTNEKKNDDSEKDAKSFTMVYTSSTKQYLIAQIPAILILHLKRFQSHRSFGFKKVFKHVSFPLILDLSPVCKNYRKPKVYSLYGIVEHSGTLHGGHYVAYVKSRVPLKPDDPRWSFLPEKHAAPEEDVEVESEDDTEFNKEDVKPPPGRWYYISDSRVNEIDEASVLQKEAYLLFYERII